MADTMERAFRKVCDVFGFDGLNTHQKECLKYIVKEKKDIFVNLPMGFRKSLIYQALPLVYSCMQSTDQPHKRSGATPKFPGNYCHIFG